MNKIINAMALLLASTVVGAGANGHAATVEEVALYNKPDRQKVLVDGARKEGKITWYTSLIVDQVVRPVKEAFEKKYPFIQIEHFRGNSERIVQKMFSEYQGKRYEVDIADGTVTAPMIKKGGYLQRFYSPHLADYPAELKDPQGYWGVSNVYYFAVGYNTRMVKPNEVPKSYDDLLNPRWKGQMMWSTSRGSGAPMMIGNVFQSMGQEAGKAYLQKLKAQNVAKSTASNRQLLDLVIAGEYPIGLMMFNHHTVISAQRGAPWMARPEAYRDVLAAVRAREVWTPSPLPSPRHTDRSLGKATRRSERLNREARCSCRRQAPRALLERT